MTDKEKIGKIHYFKYFADITDNYYTVTDVDILSCKKWVMSQTMDKLHIIRKEFRHYGELKSV